MKQIQDRYNTLWAIDNTEKRKKSRQEHIKEHFKYTLREGSYECYQYNTFIEICFKGDIFDSNNKPSGYVVTSINYDDNTMLIITSEKPNTDKLRLVYGELSDIHNTNNYIHDHMTRKYIVTIDHNSNDKFNISGNISNTDLQLYMTMCEFILYIYSDQM